MDPNRFSGFLVATASMQAPVKPLKRFGSILSARYPHLKLGVNERQPEFTL